MQQAFSPLDFSEDLYFIYRTMEFVDALPSYNVDNSDISSPLHSPPASSPLSFQTTETEMSTRKRGRSLETENDIFSLAQPLKLQQRKSYIDETRYLHPNPVITVRYLTEKFEENSDCSYRCQKIRLRVVLSRSSLSTKITMLLTVIFFVSSRRFTTDLSTSYIAKKPRKWNLAWVIYNVVVRRLNWLL